MQHLRQRARRSPCLRRPLRSPVVTGRGPPMLRAAMAPSYLPELRRKRQRKAWNCRRQNSYASQRTHRANNKPLLDRRICAVARVSLHACPTTCLPRFHVSNAKRRARPIDILRGTEPGRITRPPPTEPLSMSTFNSRITRSRTAFRSATLRSSQLAGRPRLSKSCVSPSRNRTPLSSMP